MLDITIKYRMADIKFIVITTPGKYSGIKDPKLREYLVELFVLYSWPM